MKIMIQICVIGGIAALATGCASSGIMADRRQDAADIFNCSLGFGLGAAARVGPAKTGLIAQGDIAGHRGGQPCSGNPMFLGNFDAFFLGFGVERFSGYPDWVEMKYRGKDFEAEWAGPPIIGIAPLWRYSEKKHRGQLYQVDVTAALGLSLRLGFNPAEFLDFILGWWGVDILDDDMETKKKAASNQTSDGIRQPADGSSKPSM